jgi:hypothetical protein
VNTGVWDFSWSYENKLAQGDSIDSRAYFDCRSNSKAFSSKKLLRSFGTYSYLLERIVSIYYVDG